MAIKRWAVLSFTVLLSAVVSSHSGGLDKNGGHNDRKNGGYHCHREPCISGDVSTPKTQSNQVSRYDRDDWKHWIDEDGDCMNTRHEMLLAQADGEVNLSPDGCYVSTGTWDDPFSGKTFHRASDLDVDHIIPLKWAHDHGGASWSARQKETFANDPLNLLVVDDGLNQSKSAQGPTEWMPPNHGYRCDYLDKWQDVLKKYLSLQMRSAELRVFKKQLDACK